MYRYTHCFHYKTYSKIETSKDKMKINKNGSSNIFFFLHHCGWSCQPPNLQVNSLPFQCWEKIKDQGGTPWTKKRVGLGDLLPGQKTGQGAAAIWLQSVGSSRRTLSSRHCPACFQEVTGSAVWKPSRRGKRRLRVTTKETTVKPEERRE